MSEGEGGIAEKSEEPATPPGGNPLKRADGGLLALNLSALTLISGAESRNLLAPYVNVQMLVGGLAVGALFAIVSAYFLVFGTRAAALVIKRRHLKEPAFETELTFSDRGIGQPLIILCLPLLIIFCVIDLPSIFLHLYSSSYKVPWWYAPFTNVLLAIIVALLMYLPFYLWETVNNILKADRAPKEIEQLLIPKKIRDSRVSSTMADPPQDARAKRLVDQIAVIQAYRTAAAVISLGGFILGVGLALLNVSAVNVGAGLLNTDPLTGASKEAGKQGGNSKTDPDGQTLTRQEIDRLEKYVENVSKRTTEETIKRTFETVVRENGCEKGCRLTDSQRIGLPSPLEVNIHGWPGASQRPVIFPPIHIDLDDRRDARPITVAFPSTITLKNESTGADVQDWDRWPADWLWTCSWDQPKLRSDCRYSGPRSDLPMPAKP